MTQELQEDGLRTPMFGGINRRGSIGFLLTTVLLACSSGGSTTTTAQVHAVYLITVVGATY
ncbi:MAG: hypothetical protein ABIP53_03320 [Candidatus Limnocylindrales bacterium]